MAVVDKDREHDPTGEAFRLHYGKIYRYLRSRTGSHHEAEELAQRVFADAAAAQASKNPPNSILAWLYAIAERRFVDELRRRKRSAAARDRYASTVSGQVEPVYGPNLAAALKRAIALLPADQRDVVVMKLFQERRFSEIAEKLGTTEAACKMRFYRALRTLRDELRTEGLEP